MVKPLYSVFRECRHSKKFCQLIYKNNQTDSTHSESCFFSLLNHILSILFFFISQRPRDFHQG